YCLTPVIDFQVKYLHLPRTVAIAGVGVAGLLISLLLMYLTAEAISDVADHSDEYREEINRLTNRGTETLDRMGIHPRAEEMRRLVNILQVGAAYVVNGLTDLLTTGILVVIFMIFILLGRRGPPPDPTSLLGEIESGVRSYLV